MAILINDNYSLSANKPFDARYLNISTPWTNCAEVLAGIPTYRYIGLTVNINGEEWWWKDGVLDTNLVPKTLGGTSNLSGATNGLQLLCSNTYVGLGGELTQNTTIYGAHSLSFGNVLSGLTAISAVTPTFHIQSDNGNSSINFLHDENEPRFDVCLYGENADSNASMVLDVDVNNGCFIANIAPNIICNSNLSLCTTDNNTKIFNVNSTNSILKYNNEAWISSTCKMTCESITDRSNSALNIKSVMNYNDRSFSFIKDDFNILNILSGGTARYGSNVTLNNDCDLVHKWYVDNATSSLSANNGLTKNGTIISLGGTLTGDTNINLNNQQLTFNGAGSGFDNFFIGNSNTIGYFGVYSDYFDIGTNLELSIGTTNGGVLNITDTDNIFDDRKVTKTGLLYGGDYESTFVNRSLVTKQYVTSITSGITGAFTIANNGLNSTGNEVHLGGNLTGNTTINGIGNHHISFTNINDFSAYSCTNTNCATTSMLIRTPNFSLHNGINYVMNITSNCNIFTDATNSEGFVYADNYCAIGKTNPRWIPDNEYITGLTSGGIYTANNGITKTGTDIKLGGTLCENTNICLGGLVPYNLLIKNSGSTTCTVADFNSTTINLCASNVNSPFQVSKITAGVSGTIICNGFANCYSSLNMSNSLVNMTICGGATNASFIVTDNSTTPRGIEYAADYSSTFSDCSLVTKQYVTGLTSIIQSEFEQAITGATNGLTKIGQNVKLGGLLNETTAISGNTNELYFGTYDSTLSTLYQYGNNIYSIGTSSIESIVGTTNYGCITNDCCHVDIYACISGISSSRICVESDNGIKINTDGTVDAMYYAADYSSKYTPRTIPDVAYVTGLTSSSGVQSVSNGLTKVGTNVKLGGTLSEETSLEGGSTYGLSVKNNSLNSCVRTLYNVIQFTDNNFARTHIIEGQASGFRINSTQSNFAGIYYANNYCNYYTNRSLVDKEYVDNTINIEISGITTNAITGATNGLTKVGQNVCLGGNSTGVSIIGDQTGSFGATNFGSVYLGVNDGATSLSEVNMNSSCGELRFTNNMSSGYWKSITMTGSEMKVCDTLCSKGLVYAGNYCAAGKIDPRWIPDAAWVTGQTSASGLHTASNGLHVSSTDVRLGGILTNTTIISGGSQTICFGDIGSLIDFNVCGGFTVNNTGTSSITSDRGSILMNTCEVSLKSYFDNDIYSIICLDQQGIEVGFGTGTTGSICYSDDYSANFVSRSLVDKEYVDNKANVVNVCYINNSYTTMRNDELIAVSGLSSNQISLYATPVLGQRLTVVDVCGNALADPITVNGNGHNINDGICSTINTDYGSVTYVYNGLFWSAVAFIN